MEKLNNIHPGEILLEEFLIPLDISAYRLAKETKISSNRILEIIKKKRSVTIDTALRLAKYFGTTPDFWLGLQMEYDLRNDNLPHLKDINSIKPLTSPPAV